MRAIVFLVALILSPIGAFAQSAISQAGPPAAGHAPMYLNSTGGQVFAQDSGPARGGANNMGLSELLLAARGTGAPPYASRGTGPYGTNFCDYDGPVTTGTGYHFLCLSANAGGGGMLAVGYGGGASPLPFYFNFNGSVYQFPFTSSGGIVGPISSVIGDFACWNNTIGTLLKDCTLGIGSSISGSTIGDGLYVDGSNKLAEFPYGGGVMAALGYAPNNVLGLAPVTSPIFSGTAEFAGTSTTLNLQSPPASIFAVASGGPTIQVCFLTGCVANNFWSAVYSRQNTIYAAPNSEYLHALDGQSNTGLSPNWQATTPYGPAWVTGHVYPAFSFVTNAGNLYTTALGGTSGATAPTGTTTSNDGAILWTYLSATPTLMYVVGTTTGNLYSSPIGGTSGASEPVCGSGTCSDGSKTWTYVNNDIVAAKVNAFSSWVTGPNTAGSTWNWAFDTVANSDNQFIVNAEFDIEKQGQLDCAAGVLNCYNIYMSGITDHQITAEIAMAAGTLANPAAFWGILMQGPYLATSVDIGIEDSAPVGLAFCDLYACAHATAAIVDYSTSPVSVLASGVYSVAPFYSTNGSSSVWGIVLGATAASGANIASQAASFNYFNAGSVANNMTWTAQDNVMYLGSTEGNAVIGVNGSSGVSCSGSPTSSFASVGGIVTHC